MTVAGEDEWAPITRGPMSAKALNGYNGIRATEEVGLFSREYKFNWHLCNDQEVVDILASTVVHEAIHACISADLKRIVDHRDVAPSRCSAEELENICAGK